MSAAYRFPRGHQRPAGEPLLQPQRQTIVVNGIAQACGLALIQYSGMSREARALVEQTVARVDMNDLAHVENEQELGSMLDNVIAEYNREADQLKGR